MSNKLERYGHRTLHKDRILRVSSEDDTSLMESDIPIYFIIFRVATLMDMGDYEEHYWKFECQTERDEMLVSVKEELALRDLK